MGSGGKVFPRPPFERLVQKEHKQKIPGLFAGDFSFLMLSAFSAPGAIFLEFDLAFHFLLIFGRIISPVFTDFALQGY